MTSALGRLNNELSAMLSRLRGSAKAEYLIAIAASAPSILSTHSLAPADKRMRGQYKFRTWREDVVLDCGMMDKLVAHFDDTLMFSSARELCCRDVYLRAFQPFSAKGKVVLDLGGNRGLFALLATKALEPDRVISVEAQFVYEDAFRALMGEVAGDVRRVTAVVGDGMHVLSDWDRKLGPPVELTSLIEPGEQVALLKVDIEGAEEALLAGKPSWLAQVERIAMELHPVACDVSKVVEAIAGSGFSFVPCDHEGSPCSVDKAEFLYAARDRRDLRLA